MPSGFYIVFMALQASTLSFPMKTQSKKGGSEVRKDQFTGGRRGGSMSAHIEKAACGSFTQINKLTIKIKSKL